ncbi:hypothetical protein IOQ59_12780 [Pontibacterium sp. N1Y112]|uniref:Uncharacterized protein n=1 Tax=Pontibacterium sinense TaxID=2781979 RepID=A0A8J7FVJ7_9GAMM|nr:hypothetical protein [Pontibacterium sinense]MBE9398130.1 hypothetical protein [Pontibacterium sinense]MCO4757506.1 hypothetical protein [Oceanospirillaceae bacterium]
MRSNQHPPMEEPTLDRKNKNELEAVLTDEEIEATLLERLEACELTWRIVDKGLLDDH